MSSVDDALTKLRSQLEITKTESELAQRRHEETRDHVASEWELEDDFLTGSVAVFALLRAVPKSSPSGRAGCGRRPQLGVG